ncbi:DUF2637 domain-containing protein [Streptacidiphilus sp. PB12-B1b]|uniref:DUF2637 domain-containing protein n=1 Tax=Streptacidiphilus sp. PB12-B1b TaxID=2705012 RepID=UPI0015FCFA8E|nr:DUF2637 domain-containing protein [Streptacidiphilus sp. PB12-B1b]QMU75518.1 DUF2637 domain-containing protein [Streptacidiphilus sp. PB12-B1b]
MRRLLHRVDPVLVQAVIAASLSFAHLHDIASAAGQSGWKAWAYPISVDLLFVAAWRRLRAGRAAGTPVRLVWVWFLVALIASLGANVATAGLLDLRNVPAWLRILVAGWPAAAFLGGTLLAHTPATPATEPDQPAPVPPAPMPVSVPDPVAALPAEPDPVPALPPAAAAMEVPAALLAHARKVAADHRARTGTALDPAALRAVLGVPVPLADAITAQL